MDSLDFARYLLREDARNAELEQDHDGNHPAFTAGSYAEALAIAARQADETGCAWSVLDPWDGSFYVFAAGDALDLFPSSIAHTVEPMTDDEAVFGRDAETRHWARPDAALVAAVTRSR